VSPSDSTSAIGPTRYIELVNERYAIYDRANDTPISTGPLSDLAASTGNLFDVQVIWDATTQRFYYAMDDVVSSTDNELAVGFSKTASPNGPADWCNYFVPYGSVFPDYPKLGDSRDFTIIGVNVFQGNTFLRSDAVAIAKPPAGSTCPSASSLSVTTKTDLRAAGGAKAFTPVPANEIDTVGIGMIASVDTSGTSSRLNLLRVSRNSDGTANIQGTGVNVAVPSYTVPANASQSGSSHRIDTLDRRLTQAVVAVDPTRGTSGKFALWTQHTVAGGAGAEVRWYEIDPVARTLFQSGSVTDPSLYAFNAAISPDRAVNGSTRAFGGSMVLGYDTSSSATFPAIAMVSKPAGAEQSAPVTVKASTSPDNGFDCQGLFTVCRWGDYAGASPDPVPPVGTSRVWLVSQWTSGTDPSAATWRTWNWAASP
jgi:hypothetical protein